MGSITWIYGLVQQWDQHVLHTEHEVSMHCSGLLGPINQLDYLGFATRQMNHRPEFPTTLYTNTA